MYTMKANEIAKRHKVHPVFVSYVKHGHRHTSSPDLAVDIAMLTGKKPIDYISPELRKAFLKMRPELGRTMKKLEKVSA